MASYCRHRAVARCARFIIGRVVFADWLAGMGLLVIVDHGDGFMTLYGYNETTLKSAGDWVAPGDVIATVGDSGGQQQTGLYFEVRQGTTPVNPRTWATSATEDRMSAAPRRPGADRRRWRMLLTRLKTFSGFHQADLAVDGAVHAH